MFPFNKGGYVKTDDRTCSGALPLFIKEGLGVILFPSHIGLDAVADGVLYFKLQNSKCRMKNSKLNFYCNRGAPFIKG